MESSGEADTYAKVEISVPVFAKMIDHSLLDPTMTDKQIEAGLELAKKYSTATACIKPYSIPLAKKHLSGTAVGICAVVGFPHGNSSTAVKVFEADQACIEIGEENTSKAEIDMVVNVGKVLSHDWDYVMEEIKAVNKVVCKHGAVLRVIFENDYLSPVEIRSLCKICTNVGVDYVKTNTGYGFVKQKDGTYSCEGATPQDLTLMRNNLNNKVHIKASGGIESMEKVIVAKAFGADRVDASDTGSILERVEQCGFGELGEDVWFDVKNGTEVRAEWQFAEQMGLDRANIEPVI